MAKDYYDPLSGGFIETICEALPGVKRDSVVWGYEFALEALLMFVADPRVERLSRHGAKSGDPAQVLLSIKPLAFTPHTKPGAVLRQSPYLHQLRTNCDSNRRRRLIHDPFHADGTGHLHQSPGVHTPID
jgi:Tetracyclin repressor-like, C-terminal domain